MAIATAEALRAAIGPGLKARWVPPENLHLTVRFIGYVDDGRAPALLENLTPPLDITPFDLELGGCGAFPSSGSPRALWIGLTPGMVESVKASAETVAMPSFRVCFDRAESFKNGALVLRGDDGTIGLDILQQRLSDALDGEPRKARSFTPHVTLLRDGHRVPEQRIEPIEWTVREVVLVHSLIGRTIHRHLARWTLGNA